MKDHEDKSEMSGVKKIKEVRSQFNDDPFDVKKLGLPIKVEQLQCATCGETFPAHPSFVHNCTYANGNAIKELEKKVEKLEDTVKMLVELFGMKGLEK